MRPRTHLRPSRPFLVGADRLQAADDDRVAVDEEGNIVALFDV